MMSKKFISSVLAVILLLDLLSLNQTLTFYTSKSYAYSEIPTISSSPTPMPADFPSITSINSIKVSPTNTSTITPTNSLTTTPTNSPTTTLTPQLPSIKVQMYNGNKASQINTIFPWYRIINTGASSVKLADIKIRYYYTINGEYQQNFWCDWSNRSAINITGIFVKKSMPQTDMDYYFELGFKDDAGILSPGQSVEAQNRFAKVNWSNFNQTDDYSFNNTSTNYIDWNKVSCYISNKLVWGEEPYSVKGINISETSVNLKVGESQLLTAKVTPENAANKKVIWSSTNTNIATVDENGCIHGVSKGYVIITAKSEEGGFTAECQVKVTAPVTAISLDKTLLQINQGESYTFTPSILPDNADNKDILWSSSDSNIVSVGQSGKITGVTEGEAVITATTVDGNFTASCTIKVQSPDLIGKVEPINPDNIVLDPATGLRMINNQILATYKDGISIETITEKVNAINGTIVGHLYQLNDFQIRINNNPSIEHLKNIVDQLNQDPDVANASLNILGNSLSLTPDSGKDPEWFKSASSNDTWTESLPEGRNWGLEAIHAPSAWDSNSSMSKIKIGIVDGGFQTNHEDLNIPASNTQHTAGNITPNLSTLGDLADHGTHVAGIIGALPNNDVGITGLVWKKDIYAFGTDFQDFDIKYGILWNIKKGAKVINISIGFDLNKYINDFVTANGNMPTQTQIQQVLNLNRSHSINYWGEFVRKLVYSEYDFLIVQAAGNSQIDAQFNRIFGGITERLLKDHIIIVGSYGNNPPITIPVGAGITMPGGYHMSTFSNWGSTVDIVAPGENIFSTVVEKRVSGIPPIEKYSLMDGTSMAAPFVTGAASIVWSIKPTFKAEQVKEIIVGRWDNAPYQDVIITFNGKDYKTLNVELAAERAKITTSPDPSTQLPQGIIMGKIIDAVSKAPVNGASIVAYRADSTPPYIHIFGSSRSGEVDSNGNPVTNGDGTYELILSPGTYTMIVNADGYSTEIMSITVTNGIKKFNPTLKTIPVSRSGVGIASGNIINAFSGQGVGNATINIRRGINITSGDFVSTISSSSNGAYNTELPAGNYTAEITCEGYSIGYFNFISIGDIEQGNQNGTITPIIPDGQTRIILTWGPIPSDLDSHLTGPTSSSRFHVYYSQKNYTYNGVKCADLDLDDTSSYGPETTTIYQQTDGIYRFSVHDYSNKSSPTSTVLSNSGAEVKVYRGSTLVSTFNVPTNLVGNEWTVFEMDGNTIIPINTIKNESNPGNINSF
ncbi:MAG TPA: S8 family serine peptidase [Pseudobacteroides sp.]|uniref:S8 family serine peptidase n=1 Tax=Pseudobacteroides sp. TaxID=1968840 RepID=UPI002F94F5BC